jgi:hypothetical protein
MKVRILTGCAIAVVLLYGCASPAPSTSAPYRPPTETSSSVPYTPRTETPSSTPLVEDSTLPVATTATPDEDAEAQATDTLFVALAKGKAPKLRGADASSVVDLGKGICNDYDAGRSTTDIGLTLVATGLMNITEAGFIIGLSTDSYCPKYNAG